MNRTFSPVERSTLLNAIASREWTGKELAKQWGVTVSWLKLFIADNKEELEERAEALARQSEQDSEPGPDELDEYWITKKLERTERYQEVADILRDRIIDGELTGTDLATALREYRSYMIAVANEYGQLLHRGSGDAGDGDTMAIEIGGVNMDTMK